MALEKFDRLSLLAKRARDRLSVTLYDLSRLFREQAVAASIDDTRPAARAARFTAGTFICPGGRFGLVVAAVLLTGLLPATSAVAQPVETAAPDQRTEELNRRGNLLDVLKHVIAIYYDRRCYAFV